MALLIVELDKRIGPAQAWRDTFGEQIPELPIRIWPDAGDVIKGTGGLRKLRFADPRRGKGKRGGLRVIYYLWAGGSQVWLFTIYDKDEADDLSPADRVQLARLAAEYRATVVASLPKEGRQR